MRKKRGNVLSTQVYKNLNYLKVSSAHPTEKGAEIMSGNYRNRVMYYS